MGVLVHHKRSARHAAIGQNVPDDFRLGHHRALEPVGLVGNDIHPVLGRHGVAHGGRERNAPFRLQVIAMAVRDALEYLGPIDRTQAAVELE